MFYFKGSKYVIIIFIFLDLVFVACSWCLKLAVQSTRIALTFEIQDIPVSTLQRMQSVIPSIRAPQVCWCNFLMMLAKKNHFHGICLCLSIERKFSVSVSVSVCNVYRYRQKFRLRMFTMAKLQN
jgi:hypothetical protein